MFIFIEAVTGLIIRMKINESDYIRGIKHRLMMSEDIPIDEQTLIYHDEILKDSSRLKDYGIHNGSVVKLVLKMRGGPISPEVVFEDDLRMEFSNSDTDRLLFLLTEDGRISLIPLPSIEVQQKQNIIKNEFNLSDQRIFSKPSSATNKELDEQDAKMTILRLKMDKIRLGKRISSLYGDSNEQTTTGGTRQQNTIQTTSTKQPTKSLSGLPTEDTNRNKLLSVSYKPNREFNPNHFNKPKSTTLQRSISLDSRTIGILQNPSSTSLSFNDTNSGDNSERSPKLGLHRTMSYLDTLKVNRISPRFPHLDEVARKKTQLNHYKSTFNVSNKSGDKKHDIPISSRMLPPLNESELEESKHKKSRCYWCNKKLNIALEFTCRCSHKFCTKHRYAEEHNCSFDFRNEGKVELMKNNPIIIPEKITKI